MDKNWFKLQNNPILQRKKQIIVEISIWLAEQPLCPCLERCLRHAGCYSCRAKTQNKHRSMPLQLHCASVSVFVYLWNAVLQWALQRQGKSNPVDEVSQPVSWQSPWRGLLIKAICTEPTSQAVSTNTPREGLVQKFDEQPTDRTKTIELSKPAVQCKLGWGKRWRLKRINIQSVQTKVKEDPV